MSRLSAPSAILALIFALPVPAALAAPVALMAGAPDARHVTFTFAADRTGLEALVIETRRVGNPGAALRIWIDRSAAPLFDRVLTAEDCRFDDAGAACRIAVPGGSADYARFVAAFRRGLTAHVEVQNAAVMEMQDDLSLRGFSRAYGR
jgi:hypothetical protein